MRCLVCNATDKWKNVDQFRLKPSGMCMCQGCGFVSYPSRYKSEADAKAYYKTEYRSHAPNVLNLYTGQRKLHYHAHFLKELIDDWQKEGFDKPVICEVGAAMGMVLNWFKKQCFPNSEIYGTEFDLYMRRNAWHEFKIHLTEDFDKSRKYDLIMSYKVLEHQVDADKRLREYVECLTDKGRMYISVPIWFESISNFGKGGFEIEYYYSTDHINAWSLTNFKAVLQKAGLEIVKQNDTYYDYTFLCKRNDELMNQPLVYDDPKVVLEKLEKIFLANKAGLDQDFEGATVHYPDFPYGHEGRYEKVRSKIHALGFEHIHENYLKHAIKCCPTSADLLVWVSDICMRYEQYQQAIKYLDLSLSMKPENPVALKHLGQCFREMAQRTSDPKEKLRLITEARSVVRYLRDISMSDQAESISWIYADNARLPTPHESPNKAPDQTRGPGVETVQGHRGEVDNRVGAQP